MDTICEPAMEFSVPARPEEVMLAWYVAQERTPVLNPKPRHHVKSFTYAPKIGAVLNGECDQTMRSKFNKVKGELHESVITPGDTILFHGWKGVPYHSEWSRWRFTVTVTEVEELLVREDGFTVHRHNPEAIFTGKWDSPLGDYLAARDHIEIPKGPELLKVLEGLNHDIVGKTFNIIRWSVEDSYLELVYGNGGDR